MLHVWNYPNTDGAPGARNVAKDAYRRDVAPVGAGGAGDDGGDEKGREARG